MTHFPAPTGRLRARGRHLLGDATQAAPLRLAQKRHLFSNGGVITDNDPVGQEKTPKFIALLTNAVIFHNALDIAEIVRQLQEVGRVIDPEDLTHISAYLTEHIRRFGEYSTHELGLQPEAYDPHLDVDFSPLRGDSPPEADGYGQAA